MKGVIFTELVNFMEQGFGLVFADEVLTEADLPGGGAFTSAGSYPTKDALKIIDIASKKSSIPADALCQQFGGFLFDRFGTLFPGIMKKYGNVDALLDHVGSHIHEEVRILYPGAQPPSVTTMREGDDIVITYESHRPLAHIAFGIIKRSLESHDDGRELLWGPSHRKDRAIFRLTKRP